MTTIDHIKQQIEQLTLEQRAELVAWFNGWEDDEWDEQMKRDAAEGKLDHLIKQADDQIDKGRTRRWP
jgi:hypothetical protein